VAAHLALIEIGREVVVLHTVDAAGQVESTRLWCVDEGRSVWLHSGGPDWLPRFAGDDVVSLTRDGVTKRYRAQPVPGRHPDIDARLREKYGFADRWVRLIAPDDETVVAVRLDPMDEPMPAPDQALRSG
jgi:hypothetical protein